MTSRTEKTKILQQNPYFYGLDESVLHNLAEGMSIRVYQVNEAICWQGEVCEGLYILLHGTAKLFKLSPRGRELIIRVVEAGASFNEVPVFDGGLNPVNVAALEECQIGLVEAETIRHCMVKNPQMAQVVIHNLAQNLRMLVGVVEELSFYQVSNRLARLLSRMPTEQLAEPITQDQLAARLGTVREVVARSLRDLQRSGAIRVTRRRIQIVDQHLLSDWAQDPDHSA